MGRGNLAYLVLALILTYEAASLELLANYKYWKSSSNSIIYDYSGNSRHGILFYDGYIVTDRGLATNDEFYQSLMHYNYLSLDDYTVSFWMFNAFDSNTLRLYMYIDSRFIWLVYIFTDCITLNFGTENWDFISDSTTKPLFVGWNLHSIRVFADSSIQGRVNIDLYLNLEPLYYTFLDMEDKIMITENIRFDVIGRLNQLCFILYELLIYTGMSDISELSSLLANSNSCGCAFDCPTSPSIICLTTYDKFVNKLGQICPTTCISAGLSCDKFLNCIPKQKTECIVGLYDIQASGCMYYCPHNSCNCLDPNLTLTIPICSCNAGYKKISDNPPACISIRCLSYHRLGHGYICDNAESGYIIDSLGEPIQCMQGFNQISSTPLICINTSTCIGYSISGEDYTCSDCSTGYKLDSEGKCNSCITGYEKVLSNPFTCISKIENCISYIYNENTWICQRCIEGYIHDKYGKCNECDIAYAVAHEDPLICTIKVESCFRYIYDETDWKCGICSRGYILNEDRECNQCESGFIEVSDKPLVCTLEIENCSKYEQGIEDWKCEKCEEGYKLSILGNCDECMAGYAKIESESVICKKEIEHCIEYDFNYEEPKCSLCETGYTVGADFICNRCDASYISISFNPFICVKERLNCKRYDTIDGVWECIECEAGLSLQSECIPEIQFCMKYTTDEYQYFCEECQDGYKLDSDKNCKYVNDVCIKGYYSNGDNECKECPDHCTECKLANVYRVVCLECESGYDNQGTECEMIESIQLSAISAIIETVIQIAILCSILASIASFNLNNILSIIGTIQILSYTLSYNLIIPSRAKTILEGITIFKILPNIFEYFIPNEESLDIERYKRVDIKNELFLINSGKILTMLIIVISAITILKIVSKFVNNLENASLIKRITKRLLLFLEWNFVIGYLIQAILELTIFSLINLLDVSFYSVFSIIGFSISIFILV